MQQQPVIVGRMSRTTPSAVDTLVATINAAIVHKQTEEDKQPLSARRTHVPFTHSDHSLLSAAMAKFYMYTVVWLTPLHVTIEWAV